MSNLNCQSYTCAFNHSGSCYASHIKVEGYEAEVTPETYCDSYKDKNSYSLSSNQNNYTLTTTQNISCNASKCVYNIYGACNSTHVDINNNIPTCETFRAQ